MATGNNSNKHEAVLARFSRAAATAAFVQIPQNLAAIHHANFLVSWGWDFAPNCKCSQKGCGYFMIVESVFLHGYIIIVIIYVYPTSLPQDQSMFLWLGHSHLEHSWKHL